MRGGIRSYEEGVTMNDLIPPQEQFAQHIEDQKAKAETAKKHRTTNPVEVSQASKDVTILTTAFERTAKFYRDLARDGESAAMRWYAKGSAEAYGFVAARIREVLDPTITVKPELTVSAIEATFQANISVMRAMDMENKKRNGEQLED